jgi:hypothetical protein
MVCTRYDMIDMMWHHMVWHDWYMIYVVIWYIWYVWYDTIWYDIWYDLYNIWHDMMWYDMIWYGMIYDMIYLLTETESALGGSSTVHIYTQTVHRTTQWSRIYRTEHT